MKPFATLLLLAFLTACTKGPSGEAPDPEAAAPTLGVIQGTVTYRERVALSDMAVLEVKLEDVSRQDVAADVIADLRIEDPGQVPIRFELEYPLEAIDPGRSYSLRLRLSDGDRLRFINDAQIPVLTRGAGAEVRATLKAVGSPPARSAVTADTGMELRGQFRYLADAARFTDCRTGKDYPVSMEGDYRKLERAYLESGVESGGPLTVDLVGRLLERPAMEGDRKEVSLIVDAFRNPVSEDACVASVDSELAGTYWKLLEIADAPVAAPEGRDEPHFVLQAEERHVRGSGGCNRILGSYEIDGDTLTFSGMGSTMMACVQGMETEQAFLEVLEQTNRFEINGLILTLYADDKPLARFEAIYL